MPTVKELDLIMLFLHYSLAFGLASIIKNIVEHRLKIDEYMDEFKENFEDAVAKLEKKSSKSKKKIEDIPYTLEKVIIKEDSAKVNELEFRIRELKNKIDCQQAIINKKNEEIALLKSKSSIEVLEDISNVEEDMSLNMWPLEEENYDFPMTLPKKVLIVGGHEGFIDGIKNNFTNAIYHDRYDRTIDIPMSIDDVWVQPDCISHSVYNNVKRQCKQRNIPCHFFSFSGVKEASKEMAEVYS